MTTQRDCINPENEPRQAEFGDADQTHSNEPEFNYLGIEYGDEAVRRNGIESDRLTPTEVRTLQAIGSAAGFAAARTDIFRQAHGYEAASTNQLKTVSVYASRLRRHVSPLNLTIDTAFGVGHRLIDSRVGRTLIEDIPQNHPARIAAAEGLPSGILHDAEILYKDGLQVLNAGPKETRIAALLLRNLGETISQKDLYEEVWGQEVLGEADLCTLKVILNRMRKKLAITMPEYTIVTEIKRGYKIVRTEELTQEPTA